MIPTLAPISPRNCGLTDIKLETKHAIYQKLANFISVKKVSLLSVVFVM